jgi:sec-independent protein translocase protein TatC
MPNIDIGHLALIAVIALVVFGPQRLQDMGKSIGRTIAEFRQASQEMTAAAAEAEAEITDAVTAEPAANEAVITDEQQAPPGLVQGTSDVLAGGGGYTRSIPPDNRQDGGAAGDSPSTPVSSDQAAPASLVAGMPAVAGEVAPATSSGPYAPGNGGPIPPSHGGLLPLSGDGDGEEVPQGEKLMTLIEHIEELRNRIIWGAIPILVMATACFFLSDWILRFLKAPAGASFQINAFGPMDGFMLKWKVALYAGLIFSSPFWIYQFLAYLSPALQPRERRFVFPTLASISVLLLAGTAFGYLLLGSMVRIMISMFGKEITYLPNAGAYISFVTFFMLACGIVFELPVALLGLVRLGVLKVETLRHQRKIAYFALFVFAEIITPVSDPFVGPAIVLVPLIILYEGAILATRFVLPHGEQRTGTSS